MLGMYTADFSWEFLTCATKTYSGDDTFCPVCKTEPENEIISCSSAQHMPA